MWKGPSDRLRYVHELAEQRAYSWIVAAMSFGWTLFNLWREHWATPAQQAATRAVNVLPNWPLSWWISISFVFLVLWLFEASFLRQRPGLQLSYDHNSHGVVIQDDKLLGYTTGVTVTNGTPRTLERCQVQLRIATRDGVKRPEHARFVICPPFSLRPDEHRDINVFEYEFDTPRAPLAIRHFLHTTDGWKEFPDSLVLYPGSHDIVVEAIAADSRIAKLTLHLSNNGDRWHINGQSTAEKSV